MPQRFLPGLNQASILVFLLRTTRWNHSLPAGSQRSVIPLVIHSDNSDHNRHLFVPVRISCNRVLKEVKCLFSDRIRHRLASKNFGSHDYCNRIFNKIKSSILPLFPKFEMSRTTGQAESLAYNCFLFFNFYSCFIWSILVDFQLGTVSIDWYAYNSVSGFCCHL